MAKSRKSYYVHANPAKQAKYKKLIKAVQEELAKAWIHHSLKCTKLARDCGLSSSTVSNTLHYRKSPKFLTAMAIGDCLGFDIVMQRQKADTPTNVVSFEDRARVWSGIGRKPAWAKKAEEMAGVTFKRPSSSVLARAARRRA